MTGPTTAREALIAEALGELGRLLRRQEALLPLLDAANATLVDAQAQLEVKLSLLDTQVNAMAERLKVHAMKAMIARVDDAGRQLASTHAEAFGQAARGILRSDLIPRLRRVVNETDRPWHRWMTHAAVAALASTATLVMQSGLCSA